MEILKETINAADLVDWFRCYKKMEDYEFQKAESYLSDKVKCEIRLQYARDNHERALAMLPVLVRAGAISHKDYLDTMNESIDEFFAKYYAIDVELVKNDRQK